MSYKYKNIYAKVTHDNLHQIDLDHPARFEVDVPFTLRDVGLKVTFKLYGARDPNAPMPRNVYPIGTQITMRIRDQIEINSGVGTFFIATNFLQVGQKFYISIYSQMEIFVECVEFTTDVFPVSDLLILNEDMRHSMINGILLDPAPPHPPHPAWITPEADNRGILYYYRSLQ